MWEVDLGKMLSSHFSCYIESNPLRSFSVRVLCEVNVWFTPVCHCYRNYWCVLWLFCTYPGVALYIFFGSVLCCEGTLKVQENVNVSLCELVLDLGAKTTVNVLKRVKLCHCLN